MEATRRSKNSGSRQKNKKIKKDVQFGDHRIVRLFALQKSVDKVMKKMINVD